MVLFPAWLVCYGIRRGIIERHTTSRGGDNYGRDAFRHSVILVAAGLGIEAALLFKAWRG